VDQFSNLVLQNTVERIHSGSKYGDIQRGIFLIRGENIVLLGEVDESKELASPLKEVPVDVVLEEQNEEQRLKEELQKTRNKARLERGLAPIDGGHDD